jgi:HK97 family phage major capsid protein
MKNAKKIEALEAKKLDRVNRAKAIATAADDQHRDLLQSERSRISDLIEEAKSFHAEIETLKGDDQWQRDLSMLGAAPAGGSVASMGPRSGQRAGKGWAAPVMAKYLENIGAKQLVPAGQITVPTLDPQVVESEDRPRSLLQLIPSERLEGTDQFAFLRETVRQHNASTVRPGQRKPTSVYSIEKVEGRAVTIAHLSEPIERQTLMDNELLQQYLDGALRAGVELELEDQVLNGDGDTTGVRDDMVGIRNTSGIQVVAFDGDRLATARRAVTALETTHIDMRWCAWTMSPSEWEAFELLQSDEFFTLGGPGAAGGGVLPVDRGARRLWGFPVVVSTAIEDGVTLFGDWGGSVQLRPREEIVVTWSEAVPNPNNDGATGFEENTLTFRAEGRWGIEVSRPRGFVEVALEAAGSGS